jgi:hypothetical protein
LTAEIRVLGVAEPLAFKFVRFSCQMFIFRVWGCEFRLSSHPQAKQLRGSAKKETKAEKLARFELNKKAQEAGLGPIIPCVGGDSTCLGERVEATKCRHGKFNRFIVLSPTNAVRSLLSMPIARVAFAWDFARVRASSTVTIKRKWTHDAKHLCVRHVRVRH